MISLSVLHLELDWKGWATFSTNALGHLQVGNLLTEPFPSERVVSAIVKNFSTSMSQLKVRQVCVSGCLWAGVCVSDRCFLLISDSRRGRGIRS